MQCGDARSARCSTAQEDSAVQCSAEMQEAQGTAQHRKTVQYSGVIQKIVQGTAEQDSAIQYSAETQKAVQGAAQQDSAV